MNKEKKQSKYFRGDVWFNKHVDRRTREALTKQHKEFAQIHRSDTNTQLLTYVRKCAAEFGFTPSQEEIIGGGFIASRFGNWQAVVHAAGLPPPRKAQMMKNRIIYKQEFKRQTRLFKKDRLAEREAKFLAKQEASAAARQELQKRVERDAAWAEAHRHDTDEQLLEYVRQVAENLGRTPVSREVLGSTFITRRIGAWPLVLICAGLPLPKGMKPPNQCTLEAYLKKTQKPEQGEG